MAYNLPQITINSLIVNKVDIFKCVLLGAEHLYGIAHEHISTAFDAQIPSFSKSKVHASLHLVKDYVLLGKRPDGWFADDLACNIEFDTIDSLYTLFKIAIDVMNYRCIDLTENDRYFCCFVLSAISRFRLDAEWLGEFVPCNADDVEGVYFTTAELAALISVSTDYFNGLLEKVDEWLDDSEVLANLRDESGLQYVDIENNAKRVLGDIKSKRHNTEIEHSKKVYFSVLDQWKKKFTYKVKPSDFDTSENVPWIYSVLFQCDELKGYLSNRNFNKEIKTLYPHKNAVCLLNLLATKGYYTPTH